MFQLARITSGNLKTKNTIYRKTLALLSMELISNWLKSLLSENSSTAMSLADMAMMKCEGRPHHKYRQLEG